LRTPIKVGIEALYVYVPYYYVDNAALEVYTKAGTKHFTEGLGIKKFGIPSPDEDPASMAATAASRLMDKCSIAPKHIFRIDTATESSLDNSRALVSDVVGMLEQKYGVGSFSHVLGYEQKFACVSGLERVLDSSAWCAAGWNDTTAKYAIVLATDHAKYNLNSAAEPTQGAAAAAMLIGANPKLLEIVPGVRGSALRYENMDFKKPLGRKKEDIPIVDGPRSIVSYLAEMEKAWRAFRFAAVNTQFIVPKQGECVLDHVDKLVYHNPYEKMVMSAFVALLIQEWKSLPRWREVTDVIGNRAPETGADCLQYYGDEAFSDFRRQFVKTDIYHKEFNQKVGSSLLAPGLVGDPFTASIFIGIDSMFENDKDDLTSKNVVLCGYGSGSHAVIQAFTVPKGYEKIKKHMDLMQRLENRRELSMDEYRRIHEGKIAPQDWPGDGRNRFQLRSIEAGRTKKKGNREYSYAD